MADHPIYGNRDWAANLHADYIKAQERVEALTQALRRSDVALEQIETLAKWDGPDTAPNRMYQIWQLAKQLRDEREWEAARKLVE